MQKKLFILCTLSISLLIVKIYIDQSLSYLFLIWNLFLAIVPYFISKFISRITNKSTHKFLIVLYLVPWIVFLPNAPYIITDLKYLQDSSQRLLWFNSILIFSFAISGLLLAIASMNDIYKILLLKWSKNFANYIVIIVSFLCGFGVFLGRNLRFNSWDVLSSPNHLLVQCFHSIYNPHMWAMTSIFGVLIYTLFYLTKNYSLPST